MTVEISDGLAVFLVVIVAVALGVLSLVSMRRSSRYVAEELHEPARQLRWIVRPLYGDQRTLYKGRTEGIRWELHAFNAYATTTLDGGQTVVWRTKAASIDGLLLFSRGEFLPPEGLAFTAPLIPVLMHLGGTPADAATLSRAQWIPGLDAELQRWYSVRATPNLRAEHLSPELRQTLIAAGSSSEANELWFPWLIIFWRHGLTMQARAGGKDLEKMQRIAALGSRVARALRPGESPAPSAG